jgi:hypothetical protein
MAKKKTQGALAEKLSAAIEGKKVIKATDTTPPPDVQAALITLKGLKAGDLITVEYAQAPGRVPGIYGAEVVSVSRDGKDASIKFLFANKPPRAGALKVKKFGNNDDRVIDAGDEREVQVRRPNREQRDQLEAIRTSQGQRSPDMAPLKLNQVAAFVYPKAPEGAAWVPGVSIGIVTKAVNWAFEVTFYYADVEEGDQPMETIPMNRGDDGEYVDVKYGCRLAMVRKPTAGEVAAFEAARKDVLSKRAIPNAPKPAGRVSSSASADEAVA